MVGTLAVMLAAPRTVLTAPTKIVNHERPGVDARPFYKRRYNRPAATASDVPAVQISATLTLYIQFQRTPTTKGDRPTSAPA